jgi:hypothetical protein
MAASTVQKLKIKEGFALRTISAPADFRNNLGPLPDNVKIGTTMKSPDQVHWFVRDKAQMEEELKDVLPWVKDNVVCWIYYTKGSSKIQTDLTRDKGWDKLLKEKMQWLSLISFDDTWSAFGMRRQTEADKKKEAPPGERPVFDYVDPTTKTVYLPDDLAAALKKAKKQEAFFQSLSFTNKKEYIEWIVSAKKEETRVNRVKESVERLEKGWKNPANR